jgi:hypothetical protein
MVHPLSSNGKGDCQLEELELKEEEYEDAGNHLEQERTTIV